MPKRLFVTIAILLLSSTFIFGSGFSIYEQGSKSMAMAGAFTAQANDVTAVFFNPAGITSLQGWNIALGTTIIMPQASFTGPTAKDPRLYNTAKKEVFTPPYFYATYKINDKLAAGFGFFVPFGLGSDWGKDWPGKYLATKSEVQTFFFNPVIAYKVLDNLSVAVGFDYAIGSVTLEKVVNYPVRNIDVYSKLDASGSATGWNVGIQYKPLKPLTLGFSYRSNLLMKFKDGDATFEYPAFDASDAEQVALNAELKAFFPNTKGSSEIELPTFMNVGIAYDFTSQLTAEFDYFQIGWNSYDELVVKFDDPVGGQTETTSERKYENSASYRLGMEYRVNEQLALRAGFMRDSKAVPDERVEPSLPEGDRNIYNIGFGYKMSGFTIDFAYMLLLQEDREITQSVDNFNGKYESIGHLYGLSFGYSF